MLSRQCRHHIPASGLRRRLADLSDNAPHDVVSGAAAAGTSADASRSDHVHSGVPAPATTVVSTTMTTPAR